MTIQIASGTIYVQSPDHPQRSRIISPVAVFRVANVCWRACKSRLKPVDIRTAVHRSRVKNLSLSVSKVRASPAKRSKKR